jgi:hypothetical protein
MRNKSNDEEIPEKNLKQKWAIQMENGFIFAIQYDTTENLQHARHHTSSYGKMKQALRMNGGHDGYFTF